MAYRSALRRATVTVILTTLLVVIVPAGTAAATSPGPAGPLDTLVARPLDALVARPLDTLAAVFPSSRSASGTVVAQARRHLGAGYRSGATGPYQFDCSGLAYRVFADSHLLSKIGSQRSSSGLYAWFRARHLTSRSSPRVGDLVVYGYSGYVSHVGIYIGSGRVISALTNGVHEHGTFAVLKPFIAYLHTHLG